jgi:hypothetical protein
MTSRGGRICFGNLATSSELGTLRLDRLSQSPSFALKETALTASAGRRCRRTLSPAGDTVNPKRSLTACGSPRRSTSKDLYSIDRSVFISTNAGERPGHRRSPEPNGAWAETTLANGSVALVW